MMNGTELENLKTKKWIPKIKTGELIGPHHKYVNGNICYYDEVQIPKLKGGKNND